MSALESLPHYEQEKPPSADDSLTDKKSVVDGNEGVDDAEIVREVEAMEDRIQNDEATDREYYVDKPWEVALKVRTVFCLSLCLSLTLTAGA